PSWTLVFQSRAILDAIMALLHPRFSIKNRPCNFAPPAPAFFNQGVEKSCAPRWKSRVRRRNRATWCGNCAPWERNHATRERIACHPSLLKFAFSTLSFFQFLVYLRWAIPLNFLTLPYQT